MFKFLAIFAFMAVLSISTADFESDWEHFKIVYKRQYSNSAEEAFRKEIFRKSWDIVQEHNRKYEKGEISYKSSVGYLSDRTPEERKRAYHKSWKFDNLPEEEVYRKDNSLQNLEAMDEFENHLMHPFDSDWEEFKKKFGRSYQSSEEEAFRKGIFLKNWEMIKEHNNKFKKGEVTWTMGINNFTDFTKEEFGSRLGFNQPKITTGRQYEDSVILNWRGVMEDGN